MQFCNFRDLRCLRGPGREQSLTVARLEPRLPKELIFVINDYVTQLMSPTAGITREYQLLFWDNYWDDHGYMVCYSPSFYFYQGCLYTWTYLWLKNDYTIPEHKDLRLKCYRKAKERYG